MSESEFPFRVLIVEDDPNWHRLMQGSCERSNLECIVATDKLSAQQIATQARYHLISIDQIIPESKANVQVSVNNGKSLTSFISESCPLSIRVVYTTRYTGRDGLQTSHLAGKNNALYWCKSGDGNSDFDCDPPVISQQGFAIAAQRILAGRDRIYQQQYFEKAPEVLPIPVGSAVASLAAKMKDTESLAYDTSAPMCLFTFWERTLELLHSTAVRLSNTPLLQWANGHTPFVREVSLEKRIIPALRNNAAGELLYSYIDRGSQGSFIRNGSVPIRAARNRFSHGLPADSYRAFWEEQSRPMLWLMDAAAYFADYPLITGVKFASTKSRYSGRFIRGNAFPYSDTEFQLDDVPKQIHQDRVYQLLRNREGRSYLIELFPLFFIEHDRQSGRDVPWFLLYALKGPENSSGVPLYWKCRSLLDGMDSTHKFDPKHSVIQALELSY